MLEIREMRETDLEQVAEIERRTFSEPWTAKGFADSMAQPCTLYLTALFDGEIAGYCGLFQSFDEADITNVAVAEAYRGRGVGEAMLRELMVQGSLRGISAYTLEVRQGNLPARRLYEKLGFEAAGIRKKFYQKPVEDGVIMWKR